VVTATASGKTLCYNLPILEHQLQEPGAKALYLYPTKALAQDQSAWLVALTGSGRHGFKCGTYDGDTPSSTRSALRDRADLILTNPDMLHSGILPSHAKWSHFFEKLRFVVIERSAHVSSAFSARMSPMFCAASIAYASNTAASRSLFVLRQPSPIRRNCANACVALLST
jgi:DEAD/DEAH box helicase domain-containing protein